MMYLPPKGSKPDLVKLFVEMFGLVMPEKIAEEVVQKDVKMIFDPATKELITIIMPFMTHAEAAFRKLSYHQPEFHPFLYSNFPSQGESR